MIPQKIHGGHLVFLNKNLSWDFFLKHLDFSSVPMYHFMRWNVFLSLPKIYTRMYPEPGLKWNIFIWMQFFYICFFFTFLVFVFNLCFINIWLPFYKQKHFHKKQTKNDIENHILLLSIFKFQRRRCNEFRHYVCTHSHCFSVALSSIMQTSGLNFLYQMVNNW